MRSEGGVSRALRRRFPAGGGVRVGIGDDAAVRAPTRAGRDWVVTTDWLIEGVHFRRQTHPPRAVGWKALARSLSDLAATAAQPRYALVALAVPSATSAPTGPRWGGAPFPRPPKCRWPPGRGGGAGAAPPPPAAPRVPGTFSL